MPRSLPVLVLGVLAAKSLPARAADLPPALVAEFTRNVQPLLLNKCGAGACHGSPQAKTMPLGRIDGGRRFDRRITLANIDSLLETVGPKRDPGRVLAVLGRRHPESATARSFVATPFSARERSTLEAWLLAVRAGERPVHVDPDVIPAAADSTMPESSRRPNRLGSLLEAAANPPVLPPPEEPRGLIFPNDPAPARP